MWSGFGWGAGQSIASNMFRSPTQVVHSTMPTAPHDRIIFSKEYQQCMEESKQDKEACKQYLGQGQG